MRLRSFELQRPRAGFIGLTLQTDAAQGLEVSREEVSGRVISRQDVKVQFLHSIFLLCRDKKPNLFPVNDLRPRPTERRERANAQEPNAFLNITDTTTLSLNFKHLNNYLIITLLYGTIFNKFKLPLISQ